MGAMTTAALACSKGQMQAELTELFSCHFVTADTDITVLLDKKTFLHRGMGQMTG